MNKNARKQAIQEILAMTLKAQRNKLREYKESKRASPEAPKAPETSNKEE